MLSDRSPRYSLIDTDYGTMYGAYRDTNDGRRYWRIAQFLFPCYTMPPQGVLGHKVTVRCWVPMDDTHTMFFMMGPRVRRAPTSAGGSPLGRFLPTTSDWYGRFRLSANASNDYQIDRAKQRRNSEPEDFTGITGIHLQDQAITESMGPIYDRTREHLGSSDAMIIRVRRRLLAAARALAEAGELPPGVESPELYGARAGGVFLSRDADWLAETESLRTGFVQHPELDLSVTGPLV
jgi:phthalate 4,5-dioxygenase oxygenase subunit